MGNHTEDVASTLSSFCGPPVAGDDGSFLRSDCRTGALAAGVHCAFAVAVVPCIVYLRHRYRNKSWLRLRCHNLRWLVTTALLMLALGWIAEAILTDCASSSAAAARPYAHVLSTSLLVAVTCSIIYYHTIEIRNLPLLLVLLLCYWTLGIVAHGVRVASLYSRLANGSAVGGPRLFLDSSVFILFVVLLLIECYLFLQARKNVRQKYHHPVAMATEGSNEIKVRYRQSDVSIISKATMWWMNGILLEGYRQPLEMSNLGTMPHEHKAQLQFEKFSRIYADEKHKSADQPSLWWCYVRLTWRMMMMSGLYKLFGDLLAFVAPWVIDRVIRYVVLYDAEVAPPGDLTNVTTTTQDVVTIEYFVNNGFVLSFLLFVSSLLHHTFTQSSFLYSAIEGMQLKAAVQSYIYNKALKLASWNDKGSGINVGEITNHLSTDASNLLMAASFFHFTWTIPLEIVFIACMLYYYLGYSALIGIAVVVVFLPVQYRIASLLAGIQKHTMECMDERMKRTNELLQGIRSIKLYAWEALMCDRVHAARRRELHYLLRGACVRALSTFVNNGVPIIVTLLSFGLYTLFEGELTATKAFSSLALFNMLNLPLFMFPAIVFIMVSARVSTGRLAAFFEAPEVDAKEGSAAVVGNGDSRDPRRHVANGYVPSSTAMKNGVGKCKMSNGDLELHVGEGEPPLLRKPAVVVAVETELTTLRKHGSVLEMCDASFAWDLRSKQLTLHSINLQLPAGKLTMVVGSVGCGKSSLLSAILGEIYTVSGSVDHRDATAAASIAYCAQTAWLLNASLRDNITFGQPYEHARYTEVIEACALQPDIEILPGKDETEIGEKGISLSGGQKQRVSIARALYSNASIVLMDDPFAALDSHVRSHVFERGVLELLVRRKRTVLLVTHHEQFLPYANQVLVMDAGTIVHQGALEELQQRDCHLLERLKEHLKQYTDVDEGQTEAERQHLKKTLSLESLCGMHHNRSLSGGSTDEETPLQSQYGDDANTTKTQLMGSEERQTGAVVWRVWWAYMLACGAAMSMLVIWLHLVREGIKICMDFWLSAWAMPSHATAIYEYNSSNITTHDTGGDDGDVGYYLRGYTLLSFSTVAVTLLSSILAEVMGLRGARNLHRSLLNNIVLCPVRFFDTTPLGRIMNRFSADQATIDGALPSQAQYLLRTLLMGVAGLAVNAVVTPFFLVGTAPLVVVYYVVQRFYRATSRELQRLHNVSRSPVFAQLSETLTGLVTIRAYGCEARFRQRMMQYIDSNNVAFLFLNAAKVWLGVRLGYLASLVVFVAAVASIASAINSGDPPSKTGLVGLALAYAVMMSNVFNWVVENVANTEQQMSSVERLVEYSSHQTEQYKCKDDHLKPESSWPSRGEIQFQDVCMRYDAGLSPVVSNINLHIKPGEKVGICGRTGSGKSSLTLGLFRMLDIYAGQILIDGVNIKAVPLEQLRSRLGIIPQDPVLFSGTLRCNLDPTGAYSDEELWSALEVAQLKSCVMDVPGRLDARVLDGGENFSVGQRQLVCLARAVLRDSAIIVMDEATGALDGATVDTLQRAIATAFAGKTLITIAHRLSTILEHDTIVVLDRHRRGGEIVEQGTPRSLLQNPDSSFYSLVKQQQLL